MDVEETINKGSLRINQIIITTVVVLLLERAAIYILLYNIYNLNTVLFYYSFDRVVL